VRANDDGYYQSRRRFPSILAKTLPPFHYGLRRDRNRRLISSLYEISSPIMKIEMLSGKTIAFSLRISLV
jgi:hypothetical protein